MFVLLFFLKKNLFMRSEKTFLHSLKLKYIFFLPISFPLKQLSHELTKCCENHFHEFCCLVKNPKKKLVPEKKKMKSVSQQKQSTPKIVPSFGPNEKLATVKNVFIHIFVRSDTANILFIERKILARQGSN